MGEKQNTNNQTIIPGPYKVGEMFVTSPSGEKYQRSFADIRGEWEERKIPLIGVVKSFVSQLKIGQDLTKVSIPAIYLRPYSFLEEFASRDLAFVHLLFQCKNQKDPVERMITVLSWIISLARDEVLNHKPYNPLLGETTQCHVEHTKDTCPGGIDSTTYFLNEQISHHPPNCALVMENKEHGIHFTGNYSFLFRFGSNSITSTNSGKCQVVIKHNFNENNNNNSESNVTNSSDFSNEESYVMDKGAPDLSVKNTILPGRHYSVWVGKISITCPQTGLFAEMTFDWRDYINTVEGYIYKQDPNLKNPEEAVPLAYVHGRVGWEIFKNVFNGKPMSEEHVKHHKYHKTQFLLHQKEQLPEVIEEKQQEGYGSWMWRGLTSATSVAACYVAPAYMKEPDSDLVVSETDTSIIDFTKFKYTSGYYPIQLESMSSITSWGELSQAIIDGDLDKADEIKKKIEESQRQRIKKSIAENTPYVPRFFALDSKTNVWDVKSDLRNNLSSVFPYVKKK